jgi:F-type H+-transporting ATPase subunit b
MEQLINDFSPGLFFMQLFIFGILLFLLSKFAWRPILGSLKAREESIKEALQAAEEAKQEMANLKAGNEKLLQEARLERDKILKDAADASVKMKEEAREAAAKQTEKMIADAKTAIDIEKKAALADVTNHVAQLSLEVAEKLLRKNLSSDKEQQALVEGFIKETKLN